MPHHYRPSGSGPPDVIVKIDGGNDSDKSPAPPKDNTKTAPDNMGVSEINDPPSKLNKHNPSGGETSLDVDSEMDEFRNDGGNRPHNVSPVVSEEVLSRRIASDAADKRYDSSSGDDENQRILNRRRSSNVGSDADANSNNGGGNEGTVLKCTSIQRRFSGFGTTKTRSRLMDPPEILDKRSEMMKSARAKSGISARASGMIGKPGEEEEDDPLLDEDLPDEFKKAKFDALTIAEFISLVLIVTAFSCTLTITEWKQREFRGLSLWKWELLVLVLICGRLVSGWVIRIVVFFIERNFLMRKRVLYFVYGVRKAVQNCIWLGLLLITWHSVSDMELRVDDKFLWYVNRLMVCLVVGTLLWLVKTLMVKVLASSFHVSTFFDRIQESLFNQYVIETLSGPPLIEIRSQQEEEEVWRLQNGGVSLPPDLQASVLKQSKSGKVDGTPGGGPPLKSTRFSFRNSEQLPKNPDDQEISIEKLHKLNPKNVSAWRMKRLMRTVRRGLLTTLDEKVLDSSQSDENSTQITSEHEAISAARKIFKNVAKPKAKFIYLEDLMRFLEEEEALKVLNLVEGSTESERISKASLKSWVVNAFVERRALALTLNDTKTAVKNLHHLVNVIVSIIIVLICLIILKLSTGKLLVYVSSQVVLVAFIFGNTCKTIFESVIFVFVIHPFDVGDRCEIDGVQMVVEEMNIMTTVFLRYDYLKIIYPNVTLATRPISNYYRSPDMGDRIDFTVHIATPLEKFALIKQKITSSIENRSDHWYPAPDIVLNDFVGLNAMQLTIWLRHRMNHQNIMEKLNRRDILVEEIVKIFKELDIEYRLYPIDINVRAMPSHNSSRMPPSWNLPPLPPSSGN